MHMKNVLKTSYHTKQFVYFKYFNDKCLYTSEGAIPLLHYRPTIDKLLNKNAKHQLSRSFKKYFSEYSEEKKY